MPPESLSTLAVMKPGPRTARNSNIRIRQRFHMPGVPMEDSLKVFSHEDSSKTITGEGRMSEVPGDHHDVMRIDLHNFSLSWYIGTHVEARTRIHRSGARPDRGSPGKAHVEGAESHCRAERHDAGRSAGGHCAPCIRGESAFFAADPQRDRAVQGALRHDSEIN